jgi:hypothetical protein
MARPAAAKPIEAEENEFVDELQKEFSKFLKDKLKGKTEEEKILFIEASKKANTKATKSALSSLVNEQYQKYIDNLEETLKKVDAVYEKASEIIVIAGKTRTPTVAKLTGYDSISGDIYVEYKDGETNQMVNKLIKAKSVVNDVGKIPAPKQKRGAKTTSKGKKK